MALPFLSDGAYGQAAVEDARASCAGCGLFTRVTQYMGQPFTSAADNTQWWLFIGAILIVAYLWSRVLRGIVAALD